MTPEQIDLVINASRKILAENRNLFTVLSLLMPLVGAVIGWLAAYLQFKFSFKKSLKKEHYYQSKGNVTTIVRLHYEFLAYIYESYKSIKTILNTVSPIGSDFMIDFITEYNFKLAMIHQMSKIEFPGETFDTRKVLDELKKLQDSIAQINAEILRVLENTKSATSPADRLQALGANRINSFYENNRAMIDTITTEITIQENKMIQLLNQQAKQLGIIG